MPITIREIIIRLVVAAVLCGVIGIEREMHHKPAGIRTNALIGLGSAMMTLCGVYIAQTWPGQIDPSRIASIVVQGIGFLGAGVIIQSSGAVHGLTTAATMWSAAGIGIAVGFGFYPIAVIAAVMVLVLLAVFGPLDAKLMHEEAVHGVSKKKKLKMTPR